MDPHFNWYDFCEKMLIKSTTNIQEKFISHNPIPDAVIVVNPVVFF